MDTVKPSETCPLCLDDDADEVALCENLGDYVDANGVRQGHGVCTTCLPFYLSTGRDNCLVCRRPYGERWNRERQNHLEPAVPPAPEENEEENEEIRTCVLGCGETENLFEWAGNWVCPECYDYWMQRDAEDSEPGQGNSDAPASVVNVVQSETCPLCLDDGAREVALCNNLGDYVDADGVRQGHGVCTRCLPNYLSTGRDNCLVCRTPYSEKWLEAKNNIDDIIQDNICESIASKLTEINEQTVSVEEVKEYFDFQHAFIYFLEEHSTDGRKQTPQEILKTLTNEFDNYLSGMLKCGEIGNKICCDGETRANEVWRKKTEDVDRVRNDLFDRMAFKLDFICGFTVTVDEVRIWHNHAERAIKQMARRNPNIYHSYMHPMVFIFPETSINNWPYLFFTIENQLSLDFFAEKFGILWENWWRQQKEALFAGSFEDTESEPESYWGRFWSLLDMIPTQRNWLT